MRSLLRAVMLMAVVLFFASLASAQQLWTESTIDRTSYFSARGAASKPSEYKMMKLNASRLSALQTAVPFMPQSGEVTGAAFEMPLPSGSIHRTTILQTSIWEDLSITENIGVRTYTMVNPTTKKVEGNITIANGTISGVMFTKEGMVYIHPLNVDQSGDHMVYFIKDTDFEPIKCLVEHDHSPVSNNTTVSSGLSARPNAVDCRRRNYRLAVAATGEYTQWAGGVSGAVTYITITMNVVNAIYLRDVNVFFNLVNAPNIIFTDPTSDPYLTGGTGASATMLSENQSTLDAFIGTGAYDVGLVFTRGGSGGIASLGVVCQNGSKGRGAVSSNSGTGANPTPGPQGQWFDGATAHELAHMFGAGHTFSATNGQCGGSNFMIASSWEPGGGSTLMAYGSVCTSNWYQAIQDHYFHAGSIAQMESYILSFATCTTPITTANQAPVVNHVPAATSYNIPANTPFVLTMNATDANGDVLSYTWEQMNPTVASNNNNLPPSPSNTQGPNFRSFPPNSNPLRYFPNMPAILAGQTPTYEVLPAVARTMNFRGTVRDNSSLGGCTSEVDIVVNVRTSDGFKVVNPGWGTNVWTQPNGTNTVSVTWNVAGTNVAPISCDNVDILFSTDGGLTYPIVLASATPNDGQHTVVVPAVNTNSGRLMIRGTNNIFFSVSEEPVFVTSPLPVTFLNFSVRRDGNTALLDWSTATETNSDKFIVERSANGSAFDTQLGSVRAAGNSTTVQQYQFRDEAPLNRWNYYRLKQLDLDGKFSYSRTVSVFFDKGTAVTVYPNPVRSETTVEFVAERAGRVNIEVYDAKGALVFRNTFNAMAGFNRTTVQMGHLSRGIYTMKCYSEQNTLGVMKLVKE